MKQIKLLVTFLLLLVSAFNYAQLGFCTGSKGDPIFTENFGNGTNYGPALPAGTTNYSFIVGNPNDGSYTLYYRTNLYSTWHYSLDHTPDATNGTNGKSLIVNANASTSGDFYKRVVTGLCINTTFEFSAWLMNVYNPGSGFCGAGEIPINVRFEIWNDTETILLGSGNTGNIMGTASPIWQQYALVFTTTNQTSVVLKMKNNGLGGCGNDLAIDDIEFRSCGELTTVTSPPSTAYTYEVCESETPVSLTLQAATTGSSAYFYQWQTSPDGTNWTDIPGANSSSYVTPNLTTLTYFRTKAAQDIANLSNNFCSTLSNIFTVSFLNSPANCLNDGDPVICSNETIPPLSVTVNSGTGVNWYNAPTGGTLLQSNSTTYTPTGAGTYYAEAYDLITGCLSDARTPVTLTIVFTPTVTITGTNSICTGNTATINFSGTPNATLTYKVDGGSNQTIMLDSNGLASFTTPVLNSDTTYDLVSIALNWCVSTLIDSFIVIVNQPPTASVSGSTSVCSGDSSTLTFIGTPNATVTYSIDSGPNQTVMLNATGEAAVAISNITPSTAVSLVQVTSAGVNACTQLLNQTLTFTVLSLPSATINASPLTVCAGQSSTLNFTGTPNALVTYTESGGSDQTVTLGANGLASVPVSAINTNTTFELVSVELTGSLACPQLLSDSVMISINPTPVANFNGDLDYCSGEPLDINLTSDIVGTTFSWTVIQNGTSGASSGSGDEITQWVTANQNVGTVTYVVTPTYNGCVGNPLTIVVTIHAIPEPTLTDGAICLNAGNTSLQPYTLDTNLSAADYSFVWYYENVLITNASDSTYEANQIGTYSVVATNLLSGCVSPLVDAEVTESILGESLLISQSEAFSHHPTITVTVVGGQGPFLYQLDDSNFQTSNVFYNVTSGEHTITVVDESFCTNLTTTVTIINYPYFFTPNGDGFNDTWNIKDVDENSLIFIFDRYGKLLKQISPLGSGWDGTYNGQPMFANDYWFVINYFENGVGKTFKSHFALKR